MVFFSFLYNYSLIYMPLREGLLDWDCMFLALTDLFIFNNNYNKNQVRAFRILHIIVELELNESKKNHFISVILWFRGIEQSKCIFDPL